MFLHNPVPTAGELRSAWSSNKRLLAPVLKVLRASVYFGIGIGLAGLSSRIFRGDAERAPLALTSGSPAAALTETGERTAQEILALPAVSRRADQAQEVSGVLVSRASRAVDEAHDTVEEAFGRVYFGLDRLWLAVLPPVVRRRWEDAA